MADGDLTPEEEEIPVEDLVNPSIVRPVVLKRKIQDHPHSIFFYPTGLYDWEAVRLFNGVCDTFIYCDVALGHEGFDQGLDGLRTLADERRLQVDSIDCASLGLGVDEQASANEYLGDYHAAHQMAIGIVNQHGGPWGRQVSLLLSGRKIMVYCFRAEAFRTYAALFTRTNVAPKVVCLKSQGFQRYLDLDRWSAPLGRAVANSPQPELLATNLHRQDDWPWKREWQTYPGWGTAYWRQHPVTYPLLPLAG